MHKILLINHYAGSPIHGMEYRPFYFAREWVRAGHSVLIVAASFSHLRQKNPDVQSALKRETIDGVDYLWVRTPQYRGNGLSRVRNMANFVLKLYGACRNYIAEFNPDLVIASSTYTWDNWPAAYYARKHGARYVYELHDVWPLTPMELGGMSPRHPFIWTLQKAEDFACRKADKVVSLLPAALRHLAEHGMTPDRFSYIPNGIVKEEWLDSQEVPEEHEKAIQALRQSGNRLVGYVGGHGLSNALEVLVAAGADVEMKNVFIVCVGNGSEKERYMEKALAMKSRVLFLPPVPKRSIPKLLELFDMLFIGWAQSPLYRFGISPNKLFEYMMSGIPIVHAVDAANDPVKESGCGLSVPPQDVDALCAGIRHLADLSSADRCIMGERGRRYVETYHRVDVLAAQFLESVWSPEGKSK